MEALQHTVKSNAIIKTAEGQQKLLKVSQDIAVKRVQNTAVIVLNNVTGRSASLAQGSG